MADEAFQKELLSLGFEPVRDVGPDKARGRVQGRARALDADPQGRQHETGVRA